MDIYFIRHGETRCNTTKIIQGNDDVLTEKGMAQATTLAKRLKKLDIDSIYTSPLPRAFDTARIIADTIGIDPIILDALKEKQNPSSLVGLPSKDEKVLQANAERRKHYENDPNWCFEDEEGFMQLKNRSLTALSHLEGLEEKNEQKKVLVVTHGAILRYMLACMIYKDKLDRSLLDPIFKVFQLHNTGITHCTFGTDDESKPKRWRVINWNDVTHLEDSLENNSNPND